MFTFATIQDLDGNPVPMPIADTIVSYSYLDAVASTLRRQLTQAAEPSYCAAITDAINAVRNLQRYY